MKSCRQLLLYFGGPFEDCWTSMAIGRSLQESTIGGTICNGYKSFYVARSAKLPTGLYILLALISFLF